MVLDAKLKIGCKKEFKKFGRIDFAPLFVSCQKLQLSPSEHCPLAFHHCQQSFRLLRSACDLRAPHRLTSPRGDYLSTRSEESTPLFQRALPLPASPWPDCTLSRLRAKEYDRPVTKSIAIPEPSSRTIPTLDQALVAR